MPANTVLSETITFELSYDVVYDSCSVIEKDYIEDSSRKVEAYVQVIIVGYSVFGEEYLYKSDNIWAYSTGDHGVDMFAEPNELTKEKRKAYKILETMKSEKICNQIETL